MQREAARDPQPAQPLLEPAPAEKPRYKYLYSELKPMPDVEIDEDISIDDPGAEDEIRIMRAWTDG